MKIDSNESASHSEQHWTKANCKCKLSGISFNVFYLVATPWALQAGQRFLAPLIVTQAVLAGLVCPRWPPSSPTASPSRAAAGPVRQGAPVGGPANRVSHSLNFPIKTDTLKMVSQTKLVCIYLIYRIRHQSHPCLKTIPANPF